MFYEGVQQVWQATGCAFSFAIVLCFCVLVRTQRTLLTTNRHTLELAIYDLMYCKCIYVWGPTRNGTHVTTLTYNICAWCSQRTDNVFRWCTTHEMLSEPTQPFTELISNSFCRRRAQVVRRSTRKVHIWKLISGFTPVSHMHPEQFVDISIIRTDPFSAIPQHKTFLSEQLISFNQSIRIYYGNIHTNTSKCA